MAYRDDVLEHIAKELREVAEEIHNIGYVAEDENYHFFELDYETPFATVQIACKVPKDEPEVNAPPAGDRYVDHCADHSDGPLEGPLEEAYENASVVGDDEVANLGADEIL